MRTALTMLGVASGVAMAVFLLTPAVRAIAVRQGMLDVPNPRSSHTRVTPRGGGLAMVIVILAVAAALGVLEWLSLSASIAWCLGGVLVALIGFIDDRRSVSPVVRLAVHAAAAIVLVYSSGLAPMPWPGGHVDVGTVGLVVATIGVIWSVNMFNFMDGIDGIAASQSLFVAGSGAVLILSAGGFSEGAVMAAVLAAGSLGFLAWNWPPARIFMGDVGSGFLGFSLALCMLLSAREGSLNVWTWVILNGAFLSDATFTLLVRLIQGQPVWKAHRSHAYQRLCRRWGSHAFVTLLYWCINLVWLFPLALLSAKRPTIGPWVCVVALTPLILGAVAVGAGRADEVTVPTSTS